jgi:hypothetical protein
MQSGFVPQPPKLGVPGSNPGRVTICVRGLGGFLGALVADLVVLAALVVALKRDAR